MLKTGTTPHPIPSPLHPKAVIDFQSQVSKRETGWLSLHRVGPLGWLEGAHVVWMWPGASSYWEKELSSQRKAVFKHWGDAHTQQKKLLIQLLWIPQLLNEFLFYSSQKHLEIFEILNIEILENSTAGCSHGFPTYCNNPSVLLGSKATMWEPVF